MINGVPGGIGGIRFGDEGSLVFGQFDLLVEEHHVCIVLIAFELSLYETSLCFVFECARDTVLRRFGCCVELYLLSVGWVCSELGKDCIVTANLCIKRFFVAD